MQTQSMSSNGYGAAADEFGSDSQPSAASAPAPEIDPEVRELVFDWITETLQEAWKSPEAERKKVIKQLLLKWHPDKNADDPALALAATQHIQSEVDRLENGLPRSRSTGSMPGGSYFGFYRREPFEQSDFFQRQYDRVFNSFMEEVRRKREEFRRQCEEREESARYERQLRQRERERQREQLERLRREREEREREAERAREEQELEERVRREELRRRRCRGGAERKGAVGGEEERKAGNGVQLCDEEMVEGLLRQANHDIKAAQNDMALEEPAYEWACFKAHQAAEKSIKALHLFRIGLKSNSHELSTLASSTRDPELMDLAAKIQEIIGNNNKLYNLVLSDFTVIPHDEYTVEKALEAVTCATDILDRVKTMIA